MKWGVEVGAVVSAVAETVLPITEYPAQTAGSFSAVKAHRDCPRLVRYRRIDKLDEPKSVHLQRGLDVHGIISDFIAGKTDELDVLDPTWVPLLKRLRREQAQAELQWAFDRHWQQTEYFAPNVWLRVVFDVLQVETIFAPNDAGRPRTIAQVHEWKTGKVYAEDHAQQCKLYALAVLKRHLHVNEVYVHLGYVDRPHPSALQRYFFIREQVQELEDWFSEFSREYFADTFYPARPSWRCGYCHFRSSNGGPCEHG